MADSVANALIDLINLFVNSQIFEMCIFLFFVFFLAWIPQFIKYIWR